MGGLANARELLQVEFNREYQSHGYVSATVETRDVPESAKARIREAFAAFRAALEAVMGELA